MNQTRIDQAFDVLECAVRRDVLADSACAVEYDKAGRVLWCSAGLRAALGRDPTGELIEDQLHPDDLEPTRDAIRRAFGSDPTLDGWPNRWRSGDGWVWLVWSGPLTDQRSGIGFALAIPVTVDSLLWPACEAVGGLRRV